MNFVAAGATDVGFAVTDPAKELTILPLWGVTGCPKGNTTATNCYDPSTATVRGATNRIPDGMTTPLYRLFQNGTSYHLFTSYTQETRVLQGRGFTYEGITGYMSPVTRPGLVPLYRLYSGGSGDRLLTTSASERDTLVARGWSQEGIVGYVSAIPRPGLAPLYRLSGPGHQFTTIAGERDALRNLGWSVEATNAYIVAPAS